MIHFLRTKNNKNIVETEVYGVIEDLRISSNIYAEGYGRALIKLYDRDDVSVAIDFMHDINELNNLRGYYFETLIHDPNVTTKIDVEKIFRSKYESIADRYDLKYVTD